MGWGLINQFPPFRYFPYFLPLSNHLLPIEYHIHISQMSPQLSCGGTCQIWMWFKESDSCKTKNFPNGKISERSFSSPPLMSSNDYVECFTNSIEVVWLIVRKENFSFSVNDAVWRHRSGSQLLPIMAFCLIAPLNAACNCFIPW